VKYAPRWSKRRAQVFALRAVTNNEAATRPVRECCSFLPHFPCVLRTSTGKASTQVPAVFAAIATVTAV
jgi:hypothetical protein